jgi:ParB-like chromosome segregation protein Spo0J
LGGFNILNKKVKIMKKQPQLEIKYVAPSTLVPFVGNPRQNEQAIDPVKRSIEHFGFINPIIARRSDNMIICGHTRWKAALEDDLKEVPVVFVDMTENDAKLYNLADNKLGEFATWDIPGLDAVLAELRELDVDLTIAGFDMDLSGMKEIEPGKGEKELDENIETEIECPKCGYKWS